MGRRSLQGRGWQVIRYLADLNILGYFVRGSSPALHQRMGLALQANELAISAITRAEVRFEQRLLNANDKRQASIDLLLDQIVTLAWPPEAADFERIPGLKLEDWIA